MRITCILILMYFAAPAFAADGVVEINQACALNGGCLAGDSPDFPVTLGATGSYVLTSNLDVQAANVIAVRVEAKNVTLDLNGFSISGPGSCTGTGSTIMCSGSTAQGILSTSPPFDRTTVKNGYISGFSAAISLSGGGVVENMRLVNNVNRGMVCTNHCAIFNSEALRNGGIGFDVDGDAARIDNVTARGNGSNGVDASFRSSIVLNTTTAANGGAGIAIGDAGRVEGSTAFQNEGAGISGGSAMVIDSSARGNMGDGIVVFGGSVVSGCVSEFNGGDGIEVAGSGLVRDCNVSFSTNFGINFSDAPGAYVNNVLIANTDGTVSGGTEIGTNYCDADTTCP